MILRLVFTLAFLYLGLYFTSAQTSRYWSLNFASEPSILAGAVIGSGAENQAIYYNPALIAEIPIDNISFSGDVVTLDFYSVKNAFGKSFDYNFVQFNVLPSYVSFLFKSRRNQNLSFMISLLGRDRTEYDIVASTTGDLDVYPGLSGDERISAMFEGVSRYWDTWIGAGSAYKVNDRFSLGISSFISIKKAIDKRTRSINVFPKQDTVYSDDTPVPFFSSSASTLDRSDFLNWRLVFKAGMQYKLSRWNFGLNVTLPSINLFGNAYRYREINVSSIYNEEMGNFNQDFIIVDSQYDLPVNLKDPLSIALGINYGIRDNQTMLGLSVEFFKKIPVYQMVSAEINPDITLPAIYDDLPSKDFLSIYYGATDILNVALGYRQYVNPGLTFLGGIRTDFDYLKGVDFTGTTNETNDYIQLVWDSYHFTIGARFNISRHKFILGSEYTFAREDGLRQLADFIPGVNVVENDLALEDLDETPIKFRFNGIGIFFGVIFNFEDKK